jgi:hypothetical protein
VHQADQEFSSSNMSASTSSLQPCQWYKLQLPNTAAASRTHTSLCTAQATTMDVCAPKLASSQAFYATTSAAPTPGLQESMISVVGCPKKQASLQAHNTLAAASP